MLSNCFYCIYVCSYLGLGFRYTNFTISKLHWGDEKTKLSYYLITQTLVNECKRMRFNMLIIEHSKISNFKTFTDVRSYVLSIDSIVIKMHENMKIILKNFNYSFVLWYILLRWRRWIFISSCFHVFIDSNKNKRKFEFKKIRWYPNCCYWWMWTGGWGSSGITHGVFVYICIF